MAVAYRVRLLGPVQIERENEPLHRLESRKAQALLGYLAVQGRPVPRKSLADLLWGDMPEPRGRANLSWVLNKLSTLLPGCLETDWQTVHFRRVPSCWLDIDALEESAAQEKAAQLADAVELYRGEFLEGLSLHGCAEFEIWLAGERERWRQEIAKVLSKLVAHHTRRGEYEHGLHFARHLLTLEPWREETHQQVMRLLALSGQRSAALAQYETCCRSLADELGAEPDRETIRLYEKIKSGDLVREDRRHNLPAQLSTFIGREQEIAQLKRLLGEYRQVTLTGSGGIGKTRLAIQVGREVLPLYPHGVWLVELAPLTKPELVPGAVATVLGVRDSQDHPVLDALTNYLREKTALLVLDNCEHVIVACAQLAEHLLQHCPEVRILASSREALGIEGETALRVPSLSLPPAERASRETLEQSEALRLFIERAATALPGFELTDANAPAIVQVCRRLDGVALAIELAAARVKLLKVEQIAARLDDALRLLTGGSRTALPRQQTLRATIDWSYNLLAEDERTLLRRLSVFAGGWTLEAAEAVCAGDGVEAYDVLHWLTQLANKSLVMVQREQGEAARYRLLETTRQYAREKLAESGEGEAVRGRHLDYYMELAEKLEWQVRSFEQMTALEQVRAELDNVRAALEWSFAKSTTTEVEKGLRLASALGDIWVETGRTMTEGAGWLQQGLELLVMDSRLENALVRAKALAMAGHLATKMGMPKTGRVMLEESVALYRAANLTDKHDLVFALAVLARAWLHIDLATARALAEESVALGRELGPLGKWHLAWALRWDGDIAYLQADYEAARSHAQEALVLFHQVGDSLRAPQTTELLGFVAEQKGDPVAARALFQDALRKHQSMGQKRAAMHMTDEIATLDYYIGDYDVARVRLEETLSYHRNMGDKYKASFSLRFLGMTMLRLGDTLQAANLVRESLLLSQEMQHDILSSVGLAAWAEVLRVRGDCVRAAVLLGVLESVANQPGLWWPTILADYDQTLAATRAALSEEAFAAALAQGRAMSLEQAIAYALADDVDPKSESCRD